MKQKSRQDSESVKTFSKNHRKQSITLESRSKDAGSIFHARLTLGEFEKVCDFITKNFKNDGRK